MTEEEIERARALPHHSTAEVGVVGAPAYDASYFGALVATLTGSDVAFTIAAFDSIGRSVNGTLHISNDELSRLLTNDSVLLSGANSSWTWVYENRGTVYLQGDDSGELTAQVRDIELRTTADGLVAAVVVAVPHDRIDSASRLIRDGDDVQISVVGRMLVSCFEIDETGTVLSDPTSSSEACRSLQRLAGE